MDVALTIADARAAGGAGCARPDGPLRVAEIRLPFDGDHKPRSLLAVAPHSTAEYRRFGGTTRSSGAN
jgi:hypothetical protein